MDGRQNGWMGLDLFKPENHTKADYLRAMRALAGGNQTLPGLWPPAGPVEP